MILPDMLHRSSVRANIAAHTTWGKVRRDVLHFFNSSLLPSFPIVYAVKYVEMLQR